MFRNELLQRFGVHLRELMKRIGRQVGRTPLNSHRLRRCIDATKKVVGMGLGVQIPRFLKFWATGTERTLVAIVPELGDSEMLPEGI